MPDIDSLSVNITSSSKPAVNAINDIINSLDRLNRALNDPKQVAGAENITKSLKLISRSVNSIDAEKIKNLSNVLTVLSATGTKLSKQNVAQGLTQVGTATQKASTQAKSAKYNFNNFATALNNTNVKALNLRYSFTSLAAVAGTLYANFFLLIRAAKLLGKAMDYSSSMTEAQNVVTVVFGENSKVMNDFAETAIKDFGLARLAATEFASRFQAMGKTMGITSEQIVAANDFITKKLSGNKRAYTDLGNSVAHMSINLTKLTADIASLYNQDYEDVAKDMQAIFTGMTRPLRKYGLDLTQATLKEWAMSQGLDSNIEKMSQAEKTMLRYQYVMSRAGIAMGDFQKTQDTFANSLRTVKQLLQEIARMIGEALINTLRPALLAFKHFLFNLVDLTQNALNAIGKLLGWKQIDFGGAALIDDTEDYADALDDAAGAAKKLKTQLRGIDELNNLTSNKGGGSGGADASDLGANLESIWDMMEETEKVYESAISSWNEFGKKIAEKIKDGLSSINWDEIYRKVNVFGTNFADFLNGLIDPEAFYLFGKTLGGGIMSAIELAFSFGEEFDFENLGNAIAEGINGFFDEFDGGKLAHTVNVWVDGLERTFKTAAKKIKWKNIFEDLFTFFDNLEIDSIGLIVGAGTVIYGVPAISNLLATQLGLTPLTLGVITIASIGGFKIGNWLSDQWDEALGTDPHTGESYWYEYFEVVLDSARNAFNGLAEKDPVVKAEDLFERYEETDQFLLKYFYLLASGWGLLFEKISEEGGMADGIRRIKTNIENLFNSTFGDDKTAFWSAVLFQDVEILPMVEEFVNSIMDPLSKLFVQKLEKVGEELETLKKKFETFKQDSAKIFDSWYKNNIKPLFENILKSAKEKWEEIKKFFNDAIPKWINDKVKPLFDYNTWLGYLSGIKDAFSKVWDDALGFAKGFFNNISEFAEKFINGAIDGFSKLADAKSAVSDIKTLFNISHVSLPRFASGGYPQMGSLFWANEAGPELVGTMNGKTAVASNNEITGIAQAIRSSSDAEIALLRQQNTLLEGILNKETGISKDDLFKSVQESAREFTNSTGKLAF